MTARLYTDLAAWWPLVSDPAGYAEEASTFEAALRAAVDGRFETLLELGSGGGNTASHLKASLRLTLADPSDGMRACSRALNPECEHVPGDMRTLRLGRAFDAVLIHDAVMYMTTEADLSAALRTAHAHCRDGGAALVVPDFTRETFAPGASHGGRDAGGRGLRYLEWTFDDDPADTAYTTAYAFLLREPGAPPRCEHDEHRLGLFPRATWLALLREAGFEPQALPFRHSTFPEGAAREMFVGRRRAAKA